MRLVWAILQPSNSLFLLLALGVILMLARRRNAARWLLSLTVIAFTAIMVLPLSGAMMLGLESRFPRPSLPAHVDGIITLGGAINTHTTEYWGRPQLNERAERLTEAIALARRYPNATLLVSGGHWAPRDRLGEAEVARTLFGQLGQPTGHAVFENQSTTTWENGVFSKALVKPKPGQVWILVTSSFHMPRAVGVFRKLGWEVVPYPVDYYTTGKVDLDWSGSIGERLAAFDFITREWLALAAYYLKGRTSELFPRDGGGSASFR
jgi:uncharacterized SAM-binding protein YcdF (DUF218 family)